MKVFRALACRSSLLAALVFALLPAKGANCAPLKWLSPPQDSVVAESPLTVRGFSPSPLPANAKVEVKTPSNPSPIDETAPSVQEGQFFTFTVSLAPGQNRIIFGNEVLNVFYEKPGQPKAAGAPPEYARVSVHKAVAESCTQCHWVWKGELTLNSEMPQLCTKCHNLGLPPENSKDAFGHHINNITRYCVGCHDPHYSSNRSLLKGKGTACTGCHKDYRDRTAHLNNGGEPCAACHNPHYSVNDKLLKNPKAELCLPCHENKKKPGPDIATTHRPVQTETCYACHLPHSDKSTRLLKSEAKELCLSCHANAEYGAHKKDLGSCVNCHEPHLSGNVTLLKAGTAKFCLGCHDSKAYSQGQGHKSTGPLECLQCHSPHKARIGKDVGMGCGVCHSITGEAFSYAHGSLPFQTDRQCFLCHGIHKKPEAKAAQSLLEGPAHFPIKNGGCGVCHKAENGKIAMRYLGSENCIRCHGNTVGTSSVSDQQKIHAPIRQNDCLACHSPHVRAKVHMLLDEQNRICDWCHGAMTRMGQNRHKALDDALGCGRCHLPHTSETRPLLVKPQPELCLDCHPAQKPDLKSPLLHGAMKEGQCSECHNPHTGDDAKLVWDTRGDTCAGCHPEAFRDKEGKPFSKLHGPVGANGCTACHYMGHMHKKAGDKFLEADPPWKICTECHEVADSHVPSSYLFRLARNQNGCLGCHYPHGSRGTFMLRD